MKVLWDINVQCDNVIEARKPDITLIDKKEPGLKERDWKIVEGQNGRSHSCSDRSPWKCQKRI